MTDKLTVTTQGRVASALGRIRSFDLECRRVEYTNTDEAWEILNECARALASVARECNGRKYSVHVRLADEIYAADEIDAFDQMMDALDNRDGFEIMGHDIMEEKEL